MKILLGGLLALSLALNVFLWSRFSAQQNEMESLRASANEAEELRRQSQDPPSGRASAQQSASSAEVQELARLRNEVGPLRQQAAEAASLRGQAAEAAQLRAQLAVARKDLTAAAEELAGMAKIPPEQLQALKQDAQSIACANNMKQIGIAARVWAQDNEGVFPPNLAVMKLELVTPKILFCPATPGGVPATEWSQLNPATISYQYLNPNGTPGDSQKVLTTCPIHGHVGLSDGSVHRK